MAKELLRHTVTIPTGLMRLAHMILLAAALATLTIACSNETQRASVGGSMEAPPETRTPASDASTTTTGLTAGEVVLSPDGLGPLAFGTQAAQALKGLTQAFGRAENWRHVPESSGCPATRIFTWKTLDVLVNEVTAASGSMRGLVGWNLRGAESAFDLRTEGGVGIGSTVAAVRAAYGEAVTIAQANPASVLTMPGSGGVMTGELDGQGDRGKIRTLRAGIVCGL